MERLSAMFSEPSDIVQEPFKVRVINQKFILDISGTFRHTASGDSWFAWHGIRDPKERIMPDNKVIVHIWLPTNMGVLGEIAKFAGVGHAAISLRHNDTDHYITWMAHGSPFGGFEIDTFRHIDSWTKAQDRQNMMQFFNTSPPTHTVRLKTKQQPTDQGLD